MRSIVSVKKLFSRRNKKQFIKKATKIMTLMVMVIAILGSSLKPVSGSPATGSVIPAGEKVIGIDLGTTQSVLAYSYDGKTIIIPNDQGNRITPSIAAFTDTEILIGDAAYNQMGTNPKNTVFDAKRFIGRNFNDPTVQRDIKLLPFEVVNKNNKPYFQVEFQGESREFSAEEISAMVLKKLKETAEAYLGEPVSKAVITVPAYFDDMQKQATKDAGAIAGLDVIRIINEPTSAAIAYGIDKKHSESKIIIYDLGGGTFDVSLLTLDEGVFEVEATSGDTHLGGEDFDENVLRFFIKQFKKKHGLDLSRDDRALSKLRKECEKAKRELSSVKQIKIEIENIMNGLDFSEMLTRARFEDLNMKLFKKTLKPLEQVLADSGLKKNQIDEVVLVGGSTRIPKIQQLVKDFFNGKEPNRGINPDEAVAFGASIQAAILGDHYGAAGDDDEPLVLDKTGLSLGIETVGGIMTKLIPRGTTFPASKSQIFSTHQDNQDSVLIQVFQGERAETKHNRFLGKLMLSGIPPQPRGVPQIEVKFQIDANGILQVEAYEKSGGGTKQSLTIKRDEHSNLSPEEIERIVAEFEKFATEDAEIVKRTQAKNKLEADVVALKSKLYDKNDSGEYDELMQVCEKMMEWLDDNADTADSEDFVEKQQEFDEIVGQTFGSSHGGGYEHDDHFDHEDL